jgi:hypothetical protein
MSSFDLLSFLFLAGWLLFESRQEAGRSLADAMVTFLALHFTGIAAPAVTAALHWAPYADSGVSPHAELLCFGVLWAGGLCLSREWHRRTRWSADVMNPIVGCACGFLVAIMAGHALTDASASMAIMSQGELPTYYKSSRMATELRTFASYQHMLDTFHAYQYGGQN